MHSSVCKQNIGQRSGQEDRYFCNTTNLNGVQISTLAVADGMGGHEAGEIAAGLAIEAIVNLHDSLVENDNFGWDSVRSEMSKAINFANQKVADHVAVYPQKSGMGTTLTFAVIIDNETAIGHIGDSRAYMVSSESLRQLTTDHTAVQDALDRGLDISSIGVGGNALLHCLDGSDAIKFDIYPSKPETKSIDISDSLLLICSDGLYGVLDADAILATFHDNGTLIKASNQLIDDVVKAGAVDNVTLATFSPGEYDVYDFTAAVKVPNLALKSMAGTFVGLFGLMLVFLFLEETGTINTQLTANLKAYMSENTVFGSTDTMIVDIISPADERKTKKSDILFKWSITPTSAASLKSLGILIESVDRSDSVLQQEIYTSENSLVSVFSENNVITFELDSSLFEGGRSYRWQPVLIDSVFENNSLASSSLLVNRTGYSFYIEKEDTVETEILTNSDGADEDL